MTYEILTLGDTKRIPYSRLEYSGKYKANFVSVLKTISRSPRQNDLSKLSFFRDSDSELFD